MEFFKKEGNPSQEEQSLIQQITELIQQKGILPSDVQECFTIEDLQSVLLSLQDNFEEFEEVKESPQNEVLEQENERQADHELDLPIESQNTDLNDEEFIAPNYEPFEDEIKERSYNKQQVTLPNDSEQEQIENEDLIELPESPKKDLDAGTKRKVAEQTAKAILKGYAQIAPIPFKWMSKISEEKVDKLVMNGEIDATLEVSEGLKFEDFVRQTNEQIDEVFEVDDDTLEDIKEPLIDVLMEQELELTPTQRLTMAVVSHLAQMFTVALKLRNQNNRILAYQKYLTQLTKNKVA